MRTSIQRDIILKIINNNYSHLTATEVYELAKKEISNISLGTVYRNINQLCDNNLIKRIKLNESPDRFDNMNKVHAHFICNKCGKLEDIFDNVLEEKNLINDNLITDYDLVFKGICSICQKKED